MKVLTRSQIRAAEESAVLSGAFSLSELMYNAGNAAAKTISEHIEVLGRKIAVVCGNGNNGGDGIVIADMLSKMGADVTLVFPLGIPDTDTAAPYIKLINSLNVLSELPQDSDIILDALFGIGLNRPLDGRAADIVSLMNHYSGVKIAVDVPSGIDCDGTAPGKAFKADFTVTFIALKPCFLLPHTSDYCGEVYVVDIGAKANEYSYQTVSEPTPRKRLKNTHKGDYGTALMICGSYGMCGAQILSARAALALGVGIVKSFVCDKNYSAFCVAVPEAVTVPVLTTLNGAMDISDKQLTSNLSDCNALLIGCGLGTSDEASKLVEMTLEHIKVPTVIDADGINILAKDISILKRVKAPVIITPHPKEMSRLCNTTVADIEDNRVQYALRFAQEYGCVVVLKGANTIISTPAGRVYFNTTGNPGMATGGSGDVLSGMIVSRLAQGEDILNAALSSVWLHGKAGDMAAERLSMTSVLPSDIIEELREMSY